MLVSRISGVGSFDLVVSFCFISSIFIGLVFCDSKNDCRQNNCKFSRETVDLLFSSLSLDFVSEINGNFFLFSV